MQVNIGKISQNQQNQTKTGKNRYRFNLLGGTLELRLFYTIFFSFQKKIQKYFFKIFKNVHAGKKNGNSNPIFVLLPVVCRPISNSFSSPISSH